MLGIGSFDSIGTTISGNICYNNRADGIEVDGNGRGTNILITRNVVYGNGWAFEGYGFNIGSCIRNPTDNILAYNIAYNNNISDGVSDISYVIDGPISVYNNVSYTYGSVVSMGFNLISGDIIFSNNIAYVLNGSTIHCGFDKWGGTNLTSNYNLCYTSLGGNITRVAGTPKTWAQWQGLGYDANSINADPLFLNSVGWDFRLRRESPAINKGVNVGLTSDYSGNPIYGTPDIGAYEYVGAPADTQAPTVPVNLTATAISSSQINLTWTASTDNIAVTGYKIYRGGTQIATSQTNSYSNTGLSPSTAYTYYVVAYDAAGNNSSQSAQVSARTQAPADTTAPIISLSFFHKHYAKLINYHLDNQ